MDGSLALGHAGFPIVHPEKSLPVWLVQEIVEREAQRPCLGAWRRLRQRAPASSDAWTPPAALHGAHSIDAVFKEPIYRPSGENLRELQDIRLPVAAVDPEGVELEQLPSVILVQPPRFTPTLLSHPGRRRVRTDGLEVVEVGEHRGVLSRGEHHVLESAEHVRPDGFSLVATGERRHERLRGHRNAQMIRPEGHQALNEGAVAREASAERRPTLGHGDFHHAPLGLSSFLFAGLPLHEHESPDGVRHRGWRGTWWGAQLRLTALKLRTQPPAGVGHTAALANACAETESIERPKLQVHFGEPSFLVSSFLRLG